MAEEETPTENVDDPTTTGDAPDTAGEESLGDAGKRAIAREREARKALEVKYRDALVKAKRLDDLEAANATELEKAQKAADDAAQRATAATHRAVRSEVRALADTFEDREDAVLNLGDLTRFVGDDGEVDDKAITKELAAVLDRKPHLAKKDPVPEPPAPGQPARPTERLRPGAAPAEPQRAANLSDAIAAHFNH